MLECPDCKSTEMEYAGYEVLQEQSGEGVSISGAMENSLWILSRAGKHNGKVLFYS
ncbi:MAG: hypothetical protein ACE3L7_32980 [Candidatus Pristimantibacillus sp.]